MTEQIDPYRAEIKSILYAMHDMKQEEKDNICSMMDNLTVEHAALMLKKIVIEAKNRKDFLAMQSSQF